MSGCRLETSPYCWWKWLQVLEDLCWMWLQADARVLEMEWMQEVRVNVKKFSRSRK